MAVPLSAETLLKTCKMKRSVHHAGDKESNHVLQDTDNPRTAPLEMEIETARVVLSKKGLREACHSKNEFVTRVVGCA